MKESQTRSTLFFSLCLPDAPDNLPGPVRAWSQDVEILTWLPERADVNPMFLEKRVYQGSSGRVYPLPFIDRIAVDGEKRLWRAIHIENEFLRLMILPEIGGRIHVAYDKIAKYDFFYRQNVIKPALVGLAGPWISGGAEFNWPQHHRPATFMPVETEIENSPDGSVTVWCSDHDPMLRMKGMHGICLHPDRSLIELRVRLFNRTPFTQTFLWWANVAARVHEKYQSFFPTDVRFVADHARRAVTSFPLSNGPYYGVDYAERARSGVPEGEKPACFIPDGSYPPNDLSWYANIPVPTSYMVTSTKGDFFGGYDHEAQAGFVHVANHHIAPGKKQWTWGNHDFGYAWDRSLTENDGPYVELMAGVYTDNQPDFSWLEPWETKTFSQYWYPIQAIGVPQACNLDAALSLSAADGLARIGLETTRPVTDATIILTVDGTELERWTRNVSTSDPIILTTLLPDNVARGILSVSVMAEGKELISYDPSRIVSPPPPSVAKEPPAPSEIRSVEELYLTGLHLHQYRHATRQPELYWQEGLRRDPGESRLHKALGLWRLRRGEFLAAAEHFQSAVSRLTELNPNARDGEPWYYLGVALRYLGQQKDAYDAFYKATWNAAWRAPAYFALAECDAAAGDWPSALGHVQRSLRADADNLNARNLLTVILEALGETDRVRRTVDETLAMDPLDIGARWRRGILPRDGQESLDLAFDLLRAGQKLASLDVLRAASLNSQDGTAAMVLFVMAWVQDELGFAEAEETRHRASAVSLDYCFPSRLEEMLVLEAAVAADPLNWAAHYLLGNLLYDKRRYEEAIASWESAIRLNPLFAVAHRNLGIANFNIRNDAPRAMESFDRALLANPLDARVLYERDQLWKRTGKASQDRLVELLRHIDLIALRDDLSVELATLYNQVNRPEDALRLLTQRKFQPWEGGEGLVLSQYVRAHLLLGRRALQNGDPATALQHFKAALHVPDNLGEAKHLLANQSEVFYWLGEAFHRLEDREAADNWWRRASLEKGDFQEMAVREISDATFWSALAWHRLGHDCKAQALFQRIRDHSVALENAEPKIDYFATSLPAMLLFEDDPRRRNRVDALFLHAQAAIGLGRAEDSERALRDLLELDANHAGATDLMRDFNLSVTSAVARA